jgi:hypothetical protein
VDIARYRATLQALTEARRQAARMLVRGGLDDAQREQWLWIIDLLDSIERASRRALRDEVVIEPGAAARAADGGLRGEFDG